MSEWLRADGGLWFYVAVVCLAVLFFGGIAVLLREKPVKVMCICPHCGSFGYPKTTMPGSTLMLWILILCFVIPAVFYGLLREIGRRVVCPVCGNEGMVPQDSPRGLRLQNELHPARAGTAPARTG